MHEKEGRPAAEVVLTVLHAGGKFGDGGGYKVSGGLHGVGVSVVNALSEQLDLTIWREGHEWTQSYERGKPQGDLKKGAKTDRHGTSITFMPDLEIFETIEYDRTVLEQRFREMAFLTKGLRIDFADERGERFKHHLQVRRRHRATSSRTCTRQGTRDPLHKKVIYLEESGDVGEVEVALQWNSSLPGGAALVRQQHQHPRGRLAPLGLPLGAHPHAERLRAQKGLLKEKEDNLQGEDVREGLTAIISVKVQDPQFEGQTKTKLGNPPVEGFVQAAVNKGLAEFLEENPPGRPPDHQQGRLRPPAPARPRARRATSPAASRRSRTPRCPASSPTARCATPRSPSSSWSRATPPAARPSRAATATRRRCCRCAARSSTSRRTGSTRCSRNNEIQALITAIGTGIREEFDIEKARYHKVIVMCDADVDGAHIRTLVLTFLFREMPELIEAGYVYLAKAAALQGQDRQREVYIEKESELEEFLLRDKLEKIEVFDRAATQFKLTHARWQKFVPAAQAVRGLGVVAAGRVRPRRRSRSSRSRRSSTRALDGPKAVVEAAQGEDPPERAVRRPR